MLSLHSFLQLQGALVLLLGAVGWLLAGISRRSARFRLQLTQHQDPASAAPNLSNKPGSRGQRNSQDADSTLSLADPSVFCKPDTTINHRESLAAVLSCPRSMTEGRATASNTVAGTEVESTTAKAAGQHPALEAETQTVGSPGMMPGVTIILPVKGCRSHSLANWRSHLAMEYDGPREYLFVLDSNSDPAFELLQPLLTRQADSTGTGASDCDLQASAHASKPCLSCKRAFLNSSASECSTLCDHDSRACVETFCQLTSGEQRNATALQSADHNSPCTTQTPACTGDSLHASSTVDLDAVASFQGIGVCGLCGSSSSISSCGSSSGGSSGKACCCVDSGNGFCRCKDSLRSSRSRSTLTVRILIAGVSQRCSQKVHNLAAGVEASCPSSRYVLFLDDDVMLQPQALTSFVSLLEGDHTLFMATGYPFDTAPLGASLTTFCILVYHLPLVIAFSLTQRATFVWGGCMLLRRATLQPQDQYGVLKAWRDGGYSDDLILASICTRHKLAVATPSFAIFPQRLNASYTWAEYYNYLRRQLFVLDTYASPAARTVHHTMLGFHCWASASLAAAALSGGWAMVTALRNGICAAVACIAVSTAAASSMSPAATAAAASATTAAAASVESLAAWSLPAALSSAALQLLTCDLPTDASSGPSCSSHDQSTLCGDMMNLGYVLKQDAVSKAILFNALLQLCVSSAAFVWKWVSPSLLTLGAMALLAHFCIRFMIVEITALLAVLSPTSPRIPISHFSGFKICAALLVESLLLPFAVLHTVCSSWVNWGGVWYCKSRGQVVRVFRPAV